MVAWGTAGVAFQLKTDFFDATSNDTKANWFNATAEYGTADPKKKGTPGAAYTGCL